MTKESGWRYPGYTKIYLTVLFLAMQTAIIQGLKHVHKRYTMVDICYGTLNTTEMVNSCPKDIDMIKQRSLKKMCQNNPPCNNERLFYHCVRYGNILVEVCAPVGYIKGHVCSLLDGGLGRVIEKFNTPCSNCPFVYLSNESSIYSECVNVPTTTPPPCAKKDNRAKRSSECDSGDITTVEENSFISEVTENDIQSTSSTEIYNISTESVNQTNSKAILVVPIVLVAVLLVLFTSFLLFQKERCKKKLYHAINLNII